MQTDGTVRFKIFFIISLVLILTFSCYIYICYYVYNSINVEVSEDTKLEYGSSDYNIEDLLANVSGDIVSVVKDVDVNKIGQQKVVLELSKENITRELPVMVEVVDTKVPDIVLNQDVVDINLGTFYDPSSNILSVTDTIDGELTYKKNSEVSEDDINYYTVNGSVNTNVVGTYTVNVKAVDKSGNVAFKQFEIKVNSHGKEKNISSVAYSLVGSPYVSGGSSPSGFDCSGFVQYVYARAGFNVSRSASTQLYDGYEVAYENIVLGDIIVWGYDKEHITHTAIYVGNGLMVHASNPVRGVVVDTVNNWGDWSNVCIVSVRRLP